MKRILLVLLVVLLVFPTSTALAAPVELEFFVQQSMYYDAFLDIVDRFNEQYPDIKLIATNAPSPEEVLQTRVMNDQVPDLISSWSSAADFKQYAADGYFLDLTGQEFLNTVDAGFLSSLEIDGKDYSLPLYYCTVGLYYNVDIFEKYGLEVPQTYEQLIQVCDALKENGVMPFTFPDAEDWAHGKLNMPMYVNYIDNYQQFFDNLQSGAEKAEDNEQYKEVAQMLLQLRQYAPDDTLSIDYNTSLNQFAFGEAAMAINGSWFSAQVRGQNPDCVFEMVPFPARAEGEVVIPITVDASLSISAKIGDKKEAALTVLDFFSQIENAQYISDKAASPCLVNGTSFADAALSQVIECNAEGKVAPWAQDLWPASSVNNNYKLIQQFIASRDMDELLAGTDSIFLGAK